MSNVVCVAWTVITTAVCVLWDVITTVAGVVIEIVEAVLGWVASAVAFVLDLIFAIPFVGRALKWLWNLAVTAAWFVYAVVNAALSALGIRPQMKLRVCTVILRDETGMPTATVANVVGVLNDAVKILLREANVQIVNSAPMQFTSGFSSEGIRADASWIQTEEGSSQTDLLDGACNAAGFGDDIGTSGGRLEMKCNTDCFFGNWRRLTGLGAPIPVFVVRSIDGGATIGCGLWLPDYVTISRTEGSGGALLAGEPDLDGTFGKPINTLAHELGHMCNLWHISDQANLMTPGSKGVSLDWWQISLVRASRHVSYF